MMTRSPRKGTESHVAKTNGQILIDFQMKSMVKMGQGPINMIFVSERSYEIP